MSSDRQIEANRRNSQLPTRPRTPDGKPSSRCNALKSGLNVKTQVIPGEDRAELEAMIAGYHQYWTPTNYLDRFPVDLLVRAEWLLQRFSRVEAELWAHQIEDARTTAFQKLDENAPVGDVYGRWHERFTRLQRIDSTERSYYRALNPLQRLRPEADYDPSPASEPAPLPPEQALAPPSAPELASFSPPAPSPSIDDLLSSGHEFLGMDRVTCFATDRFQHPDLPHYFNPGRKSCGRADTGFVRGSSRPGDRAD